MYISDAGFYSEAEEPIWSSWSSLDSLVPSGIVSVKKKTHYLGQESLRKISLEGIVNMFETACSCNKYLLNFCWRTFVISIRCYINAPLNVMVSCILFCIWWRIFVECLLLDQHNSSRIHMMLHNELHLVLMVEVAEVWVFRWYGPLEMKVMPRPSSCSLLIKVSAAPFCPIMHHWTWM